MRRMGHSKISGGNRPSRICRHVQGRMALFLDGELSAREAQDVARHIAGCASCRREQEQWRQAEQSLAGAKRQIPSAGDLRAGFYARLADAPTTRRSQWRINWRLAVPALAACGLAIGWLTTSRPPVSPQTSQIAAVSRPGKSVKLRRRVTLCLKICFMMADGQIAPLQAQDCCPARPTAKLSKQE